jgi:hypothetical protein
MALTFRFGTLKDADHLLKLINDAYTISEEHIWVEGVLRTSLPEVQSILGKSYFKDQDGYIVCSDENNEVVGCVRYEPRFELHPSNSSPNSTSPLTFRTTDVFHNDLDFLGLHTANNEQIQEETTFPTDWFDKNLPITTDHPISWTLRTVGHFSQFVISSQHQKKGYGTMLLTKFETFTTFLSKLLQSNITAILQDKLTIDCLQGRMEMIVLSPREDMQKFYATKGFTKAAIHPPEPYMICIVNDTYKDSLSEFEYTKLLQI